MGGELAAPRLLHHHVEFNLPMVLAGCAGGPHAGDHSTRLGAVPDQIELVTGDEALADKHLVERRANREHVRGGDQAFIRLVLVRSDLDSGAA